MMQNTDEPADDEVAMIEEDDMVIEVTEIEEDETIIAEIVPEAGALHQSKDALRDDDEVQVAAEVGRRLTT